MIGKGLMEQGSVEELQTTMEFWLSWGEEAQNENSIKKCLNLQWALEDFGLIFKGPQNRDCSWEEFCVEQEQAGLEHQSCLVTDWDSSWRRLSWYECFVSPGSAPPRGCSWLQSSWQMLLKGICTNSTFQWLEYSLCWPRKWSHVCAFCDN